MTIYWAMTISVAYKWIERMHSSQMSQWKWWTVHIKARCAIVNENNLEWNASNRWEWSIGEWECWDRNECCCFYSNQVLTHALNNGIFLCLYTCLCDWKACNILHNFPPSYRTAYRESGGKKSVFHKCDTNNRWKKQHYHSVSVSTASLDFTSHGKRNAIEMLLQWWKSSNSRTFLCPSIS